MYLLEAEVYFLEVEKSRTFKVYAHTLDEAKSMNISELVKKAGSELNTGSSDAVVFCVVTLNGEYVDSDEYFVDYKTSKKSA
ncbi:MAG: hypothetical protein J6A75_13650 [Lachnospiraceae bacterium]|nr:hypothetical protein [Lachnospiraceae bacterium]